MTIKGRRKSLSVTTHRFSWKARPHRKSSTTRTVSPVIHEIILYKTRGRIDVNQISLLTVWLALRRARILTIKWLHRIKNILLENPGGISCGCNNYLTAPTVRKSPNKNTFSRVMVGMKRKIGYRALPRARRRVKNGPGRKGDQSKNTHYGQAITQKDRKETERELSRHSNIVGDRLSLAFQQWKLHGLRFNLVEPVAYVPYCLSL